jgi:hypothetical protein
MSVWRCPLLCFDCSNKKKVSTEGGMVIPEDGKRVKKSYLADEDSKAASKAAADGAPPGFPNGACTAVIQFRVLAAAMVLTWC